VPAVRSLSTAHRFARVGNLTAREYPPGPARCYDSFEIETFDIEVTTRSIIMSRLAETFRNHRRAARDRRAIERAITNAATPALRDELIMVAQRQTLR
jgi:hypothetical protein